jgi:hypothetical protein
MNVNDMFIDITEELEWVQTEADERRIIEDIISNPNAY